MTEQYTIEDFREKGAGSLVSPITVRCQIEGCRRVASLWVTLGQDSVGTDEPDFEADMSRPDVAVCMGHYSVILGDVEMEAKMTAEDARWATEASEPCY